MRKHIILFFSALLFLFACQQNDAAKGVIKEDKMVNLLVDVHLVDGSLSFQPNADSLYKYGTGRYLHLFKQYGTDSATFKKSLRYYTSQPETMLKMYDEVTKRLQIKTDSITAVINKDNEIIKKSAEKAQLKTAKLKQDSINLKFKEDTKKRRADSVILANKWKLQKHKKAAKAKKTKLKKKKLPNKNINALP